MASGQAYESVQESVSAPQLPSHVQDQELTTQIPSPPLDPRTHHDAPTPPTRASMERPKASWLLSARPKPCRPAPSSVTSLGINRHPTSRTDPAHLGAPKEPPCAPEPAHPPLYDASSVSTPASPALVDSAPPVKRAGKRKAAEEAQPGDKGPHRAAGAAKGKGSMFIGADESLKIMRNSEETRGRAAALVKNQGRRVTVAGGEARDTGRPKRARNAALAAPPKDDNGVFLMLWVCASRPRALCLVYNLLTINWWAFV
jgi:hypothetical protein